jgi:hypothetical protein
MGLRPTNSDEKPARGEAIANIGRTEGGFFRGVPMGLRPTKVDENGASRRYDCTREDGRGRNRSGDVEAVGEFDPGRVY